MGIGPEAKVKRKIRKALDQHSFITRFTPATGGYGKSGISDEAGTVSVKIGRDGPTVGVSWYIEAKADRLNPTALQHKWLKDNAMLGAFCAVVAAKKARVYMLDGSHVESEVTPEQVVDFMVSLGWMRQSHENTVRLLGQYAQAVQETKNTKGPERP